MGLAAKVIKKLDAKAEKMRNEWFTANRKAFKPWHKISEQEKNSWRFIAHGGYFDNTVFTVHNVNTNLRGRKDESAYSRAVSKREGVPSSMVQS